MCIHDKTNLFPSCEMAFISCFDLVPFLQWLEDDKNVFRKSLFRKTPTTTKTTTTTTTKTTTIYIEHNEIEVRKLSLVRK